MREFNSELGIHFSFFIQSRKKRNLFLVDFLYFFLLMQFLSNFMPCKMIGVARL